MPHTPMILQYFHSQQGYFSLNSTHILHSYCLKAVLSFYFKYLPVFLLCLRLIIFIFPEICHCHILMHTDKSPSHFLIYNYIISFLKVNKIISSGRTKSPNILNKNYSCAFSWLNQSVL